MQCRNYMALSRKEKARQFHCEARERCFFLLTYVHKILIYKTCSISYVFSLRPILPPLFPRSIPLSCRDHFRCCFGRTFVLYATCQLDDRLGPTLPTTMADNVTLLALLIVNKYIHVRTYTEFGLCQ